MICTTNLLALLVLIIVYASYKFQKIKVPKGYLNETKFRLILVIFKIIQSIVSSFIFK